MLPLDLYLAVAHNSLTTFLMATSISVWGSKSFFDTPIIGDLSAHSVGK